MNWIDFLIIAIVLYNVISGFSNGLIKALGNLAALVGAFILTPFLKDVVGGLVALIFQLKPYLSIPIGMAITWSLIYLTISLAIHFISRNVEESILNIPNRLGGLALGLFISALLVLVPLAAIQSIPLLKDQALIRNKLEETLLWKPVLEPATSLFQVTVGPLIGSILFGQKDRERMKESNAAPPPPAENKPTPPPKPTDR